MLPFYTLLYMNLFTITIIATHCHDNIVMPWIIIIIHKVSNLYYLLKWSCEKLCEVRLCICMWILRISKFSFILCILFFFVNQCQGALSFFLLFFIFHISMNMNISEKLKHVYITYKIFCSISFFLHLFFSIFVVFFWRITQVCWHWREFCEIRHTNLMLVTLTICACYCSGWNDFFFFYM